MSYPGDTNLSAAIQQRVLNTFAQSRDLALKGKTQEASLGCEFVLRLDPLFTPARELMDKLESGASITATADAPPADDVVQADPDFDLRGELESLLDVRDFRTLLKVAKDHAGRITTDPVLAEMVTVAEQRLEAEPYLRSFIDSAEKAQRQGRHDEALALLEKARSLDPSHPSLPPVAYKPVHDEANDRIRELLAEGQRSLDRGDYQGAIDSWSRIFLIDIDHGEATRRIENARRLKAENERKIEEWFHEGVSLWEMGTTDKAREQFERVIGLDSSHSGARDYLERMDSRSREDSYDPAGAGPSDDAEVFTPPGAAAPGSSPRMAEEELPDLEELGAAPPRRRPATGAKPAATKAGLLGSRRFLMVGGLVVALLGIAFAALYLKREAFFPNSDAPTEEVAEDALAAAVELHASGKTAMAATRLRLLPTDHPQYAEAQALIAQWEAPVQPDEPAGPTPEDLARRDVLVELARQARQGQEYLRASTYYARAAQLAPLDEEDLLLQGEVDQRLAGLTTEIELFRQGDWEFVLPGLWKLHAANPQDRDVVRLMVDSYFNLGVRDLQRGDTAEATEKLRRARELDPEDGEVARLLQFADVYGSRPPDLLHRIFIKYLRFR
jgi:tetratricopeptide (TPR) repeat protein